MDPEHQKLLENELEILMKAGIIKLASSACSITGVWATKKDGETRFVTECHALNAKMKDKSSSILIIEENFDNQGGD